MMTPADQGMVAEAMVVADDQTGIERVIGAHARKRDQSIQGAGL